MEEKTNHILKIGMLISTYFPIGGGAQRQLQRMSKYFLKEDISLFILTRRYPNFKRHEIIDGVHIYRMPTLNFSRFLSSISYTASSLLWLFRNRCHFNILHCHQLYSPATIGVLAKKILRKKVIVKVTASDEYGETREIYRLPFTNFRIRLLRQVDKFIVVNKQLIKELVSLGIPSERIIYIPNGVDVPQDSSYEDDTRYRYRERLNLNDDKIVIYTGRLSEEKCLDTLLKSWKIVTDYYQGASLLILGEGSNARNVEDHIKKQCVQLGLQKNVHFPGWVNNVTDYLLASDAFVLPSISEGLSNSLLEAMASGLAVIAGDNPGNRQLIEHNQNGILIEPRDADRLAEVIMLLLKDSSFNKRLGIQAKATIKEKFSIAKVAQAYRRLYQELLYDELH